MADHTVRSESNAPKTNKRFLSSIIKNTDDHNKTIIRAQAIAAQEVRMERLEQEKLERKARAEEAAEAERLRRLMGKGGTEWGRDREKRDRKRRERSWERRDDDESEGEDRKGKGRERREPRRDDRERRHRHHSRSPPNDRDYGRRKRHRRGKERSKPPRPTLHANGEVDEDEPIELRHRHLNSHSKRSRSRDRHRHRSRREDSRHDRSDRGREESERAGSSTKPGDLDSTEEYVEAPSKGDRARVSISPPPQPSEDGAETKHGSSRRRKRGETSVDTPRKRLRSTSRDPISRPDSRSCSPLKESNDEHDTKDPPADAEDELLRRQFSDKVAELRAKISASSGRSSRPHTSSSKRESQDVGSSSSRTRNSSPSPGPHPPSIPLDKTSRSKRSRHKAKDAPPPPQTAPPPLPAHLPSKMDKYFEESYDPRLDVAPLSAPSIPSTGLISDAEFAGWDAMLEVIRRRREDKEDKKRLERVGTGKDKSKDSKKSRLEGTSEATDIMSIEYKKRGAVREWDLGKEGF